MASDTSKNGDSQGKKGHDDEGGLGNLPPLSDFDSGGLASDGGLPPLGSFDSDKGKEPGAIGGLPPIDEIKIETPSPTGGNIKAVPPGFEVGGFASPTFEAPTKKPSTGRERTGFQDLAADSDFSPETPEIGPGPDSDIDTPLFDSAFGGAAGGFTPSFQTPAPTQAMETPLFGGGQAPKEPSPFDDSAFNPASPFGGGTPVPDFSPDSTIATQRPATAVPPAPPTKGKKEKGSAAKGGGGFLKTAVIVLICLAIGIFVGPQLSVKTTVIPNPLTSVVAERETKIKDQDALIKRLQAQTSGANQPAVSPEKIKEMLDQQEKLTASIKDLTAKGQDASASLEKTSSQLDQVRADLEAKNEEFVKAQEAFEDLQNQTSIVHARQMGLLAEVERLTGMVGTLEDANNRSLATKEALFSAVERLSTEIKEGIPLTPEKFARTARIAAVDALKTKVTDAKWVTPELLNEYTNLYQKELEIGASTTYFFAKIPVTTKLGEKQVKWAECLMKGNWAVYYRTLDGKNIGAYENVSEQGAAPAYGFREMLPDKIQQEIEAEIVASRDPDFEAKIRVIAEKQQIADGDTSSFQKVFNSL